MAERSTRGARIERAGEEHVARGGMCPRARQRRSGRGRSRIVSGEDGWSAVLAAAALAMVWLSRVLYNPEGDGAVLVDASLVVWKAPWNAPPGPGLVVVRFTDRVIAAEPGGVLGRSFLGMPGYVVLDYTMRHVSGRRWLGFEEAREVVAGAFEVLDFTIKPARAVGRPGRR